MVAKDYNRGEIDITSPFQSVKDAVGLFRERAFSGEKPNPHSSQRVLAKETQLHLAQKKVNTLKEQLKNADTTKSQVLLELEKVKRAVEDLTRKLEIINEFKNYSSVRTQKSMEARFDETLSSGIEGSPSGMERKKTSDLDSVKTVTAELNGAKESVKRVAEEERLLRSLAKKLKFELDNLKNEHSELKGKEAKTESIADNLSFKLRKAKSELEALSVEARIASIMKLTSESENAKREARETKQKAEELNREAEATRAELEEAENKLEIATKEAEEAESDEAKALDLIKTAREKVNATRMSKSGPGGRVTISRDEFESLNRKMLESEKLADMRVEAAMSRVEAARASENEASERLESKTKEIDDTKCETRVALRKAVMAETAKKMVEGELMRRREREEKNAVETTSFGLPSTRNYRIHQKETRSKEKAVGVRKFEKSNTCVGKKLLRISNLRSVFGKKKNRDEGGSLSYLPGEKPVW